MSAQADPPWMHPDFGQVAPIARPPSRAEWDDIDAHFHTVDAALRNGEFEAILAGLVPVMDSLSATYGENHPLFGFALLLRARAHVGVGNPVAALDDTRWGLEIYESKLGPFHPRTLRTRAILSEGLRQSGFLEDARQMAEVTASRAEDIGQAAWYPALTAYYQIAEISGQLGDLDADLLASNQAYLLARQHLPETDLLRLDVESRYAVTLYWSNRLEEAAVIQADLLDRRQSVQGPAHPDTIHLMMSLSRTQRDRREIGQALVLADDALSILEAQNAEFHPDYRAALRNLSDILVAGGMVEEAQERAAELVALSAEWTGPQSAETLGHLLHLVDIQLRSGNQAAALAMAQDLLTRAIDAFGPQSPEALAAKHRVADLLHASGRLHAAYDLHSEVYEIRRQTLGEGAHDTLMSLWALASLSRAFGAADQALLQFQQVEQGLEGLTAIRGSDLRLRLRAEIASTYASMGRDAQAAMLFEDIMRDATLQNAAQDPRTLRYLETYARVLSGLGRDQEAEETERRVLLMRDSTLGPDHPDTIRSLSRLATRLTDRGKPADALPLLQRAVDASSSRLGDSHIETVGLMYDLATTLELLNKDAEAESLLQTVVAERARLFGPTHPQTLDAQWSLGRAHMALGRYAEAESVLRMVQQLYRESQSPREPHVILDLTYALMALQDYVGARNFAMRAVSSLARDYGSNAPDTLHALTRLAVAHTHLGNHAAALVPARAALAGEQASLIDTGGAFGAEIEVQEAWASTAGRLLALVAYEAAQTHLSRDESTLRAEAFEAVQAASQSGAAAEMSRAAARVAAADEGLSPLVAEWEQARLAREQLSTAIVDRVDGTRATPEENSDSTLLEQQSKADQRLLAARAAVERDYPAFFDLIRPRALSLAEIVGQDGQPALLQTDEVLILISPGLDHLSTLVWAVTATGSAWVKLDLPNDEVIQQISALHRQLDGGGQTRAGTGRGSFVMEDGELDIGSFDRDTAHALYQTLFGPSDIKALVDLADHWIIVPQGPFLSLPFNALVTSPPEGAHSDPQALRDTGWLGLERRLSILPSATMLRARRNTTDEETKNRGYFGLGDPDYGGSKSEQANLTLASAYFANDRSGSTALATLPPLPGTRQEVLTMARAFSASSDQILLGSDATETNLAAASDSGILAEADVVLFATHGLVAGSFTGLTEPALALTPPFDGPRAIDQPLSGRPARLDDGLLTASEAAQLRLNADWVILSACDTAAGDHPDANGLSGLARAFFFAGARSLLVSHWKVRDDVAVRLTTDAVARLEGDPTLTKSGAVRDAMRRLVADTSQDHTGRALSHPAAWAPFQFIGLN
ncbi:MAG: tetratricopeptide repeat protein [Paracoccaceae bacterium]